MSQSRAVSLYLFSSLCFAFSTVFAKYAHMACEELSSFQVSFARFFVGILCMLVFAKMFRKSLRPNRLQWVIARGILNTVAVVALYFALQHTTITKANMLNWTFPVFVFLFSPYINKERPGIVQYLFLALTMVGMVLVISPDFSTLNVGDIAALLSGIIGGAAVSVLRESRKYDETFMVLFYLMLIGSLLNGLLAAPFFIWPSIPVFILILSSALCGFLAQILITTSSRHLEAPVASVLMSSGILIAGALGMLFFGEKLTGKILLGGVCILISIVGVSGILQRKMG
ncbi:MAG: DMT family transporter [Spirochaetales bacterium]